MPGPPKKIDSDLVEIVRDFLVAHRRLRRMSSAWRTGSLRFEDVQALVGDDEGAVLFRLKERCHVLFRGRGNGEIGPIGAGELFDLAVGSLFHEAMKFRENFYQLHSYGPKVRALRDADIADSAGLIQEFEKILTGARDRLEEALAEAETLLAQTTAQFRILLRTHDDNGLVTRFLVESVRLVEDALGEPLDVILAEVHGTAALAQARAARSYLESGFFAEALICLDAAASRGERPDEMRRLRSYAQGMQAYLEGRYSDAVDHLGAWVEAGPRCGEEGFATLALAAISRVGQLVEEQAGAELGPRAAALAGRIEALAGRASRPAAADRPR